MGLVYYKHVELARIHGLTLGRQRLPEQPEWSLSLEEVDGRDEPREVGPRVNMNPTFAAQFPHHGAINNTEV